MRAATRRRPDAFETNSWVSGSVRIGEMCSDRQAIGATAHSHFRKKSRRFGAGRGNPFALGRDFPATSPRENLRDRLPRPDPAKQNPNRVCLGALLTNPPHQSSPPQPLIAASGQQREDSGSAASRRGPHDPAALTIVSWSSSAWHVSPSSAKNAQSSRASTTSTDL